MVAPPTPQDGYGTWVLVGRSHDTGISNRLGSLLQMGCTFNNRLSSSALTLPHGTKSQHLSITPSVLGILQLLRLHLPQWPLLVSHSAKPWLLSRTPSSLQNQHCLANSCTVWISSASNRYSLGTLWTTDSVLWPWGNLPRRSHLNEAGLFWITINFSAPLNQPWLSQQSKDFAFVVMFSY